MMRTLQVIRRPKAVSLKLSAVRKVSRPFTVRNADMVHRSFTVRSADKADRPFTDRNFK